MTPSSEFLFRLPAAPVAVFPAEGGPPKPAAAAVTPRIMRGLFTTSSWALLKQIPSFKDDCDPGLCVADTVGTMPKIAEWLDSTRTRHWRANVVDPEAPGSLHALLWLRTVCSEFMFGGVVDTRGKWCLCVRGTLSHPWVCPEPGAPRPCFPPPALAAGGQDGDAEVVEYLRIAVAEGTTMLTQLYSEHQW